MAQANKVGWILLAALPGLAVGCGSKGAPQSYDDVVGNIESPTGELASDNAVKVAEKFEEVLSSGLSGERRMPQGGNDVEIEISCPSGGSMITTVSSDGGDSANATLEYNDCCYAADCCYSGTGSSFISLDTDAVYLVCSTFDISLSCGGTEGDVQFSGCLGSSGEMVYAIEVDGESYAVSGSYSSGSGSLTITGANGTWTCSYSDTEGSCSSDDGEEISF